MQHRGHRRFASCRTPLLRARSQYAQRQCAREEANNDLLRFISLCTPKSGRDPPLRTPNPPGPRWYHRVERAGRGSCNRELENVVAAAAPSGISAGDGCFCNPGAAEAASTYNPSSRAGASSRSATNSPRPARSQCMNGPAARSRTRFHRGSRAIRKTSPACSAFLRLRRGVSMRSTGVSLRYCLPAPNLPPRLTASAWRLSRCVMQA